LAAGLLNQAAGTINANVAGQSLILDDGPVTNAGQLLSTGGGSLLLDLAAPLTNTGTVLVDSASTMHTEAAFTQTGGMTQIDGKLRADNGVNVSGGSVLGMGTIVGNVTLTGGTMQPGGLTPGTLTIAGNYSQSNATFNELIGTTGNGLLSITGTDSLGAGALLNIDLLAGFTPTLGETFVLMDFGGGTGTFANAPTNGFQFQMDGFNWTIAYNADDIVLDAGSAVTTTPEPSTTVLILTGLAALLAYSFFQKRTAATR